MRKERALPDGFFQRHDSPLCYCELLSVCVLLPWPPIQYDARFTLYVHALCAVVSRPEARSYEELSSFIGGGSSGGGSSASHDK